MFLHLRVRVMVSNVIVKYFVMVVLLLHDVPMSINDFFEVFSAFQVKHLIADDASQANDTDILT